MNIKKIILEKYKIINIILFTVIASIFFFINSNYKVWFQDADIYYIYRAFDGIYHPLLVASKWIAGILAILLLLPSNIFKKWLFFVAPPILILTYVLISNISVFSDSIIVPTRAKMAENMMEFLAIVTVIFVVGQLLYDWKKKQKFHK